MISPSLLRYHMEGLSKFITILPGGGVLPIYYNITMGAGVSRDPKFVLRNIWTAPKTDKHIFSNWQYHCWPLTNLLLTHMSTEEAKKISVKSD